MRPAFYDSFSYKQKQSEIAKSNWARGKYLVLLKRFEERRCHNCGNTFLLVKPSDLKKYCSSGCAASFNNKGRGQSFFTRVKISTTLLNRPNPFRGLERVPRKTLMCKYCKKEFTVLPYLEGKRKYCSNICAMKVIGGRTTSPKASKGKSGVRIDIDPNICFYSTWEANMARVFNLLGVKWLYAPRTFDLVEHRYRPDFYLPESKTYVEVKNFMNEYSLNRDRLFRKLYPDIELVVISKSEYKEIKENYKPFIDCWEF